MAIHSALRLYILSVCVIFSLQVMAQQDTVFAEKRDSFFIDGGFEPAIKRWRFGIEGGYERNYRSFTTSDTVPNSPTNFKNVGNRIPYNNFHFGVTVMYTASSKWFFETGVLYVPSFFAIQKYDVPMKATAVSGFDTIVFGNLRQEFKQNYLYVPLHLKYVLRAGPKVDWYASAGSGIWFLFFEDEEYNVGLPQNNYKMEYNPMIIGWYAGAGCFVKVNQELSLKVEPGVRGTLTSVTKSPDEGSYLHPTFSIGIIYNH
jgi:hypothetical protein